MMSVAGSTWKSLYTGFPLLLLLLVYSSNAMSEPLRTDYRFHVLMNGDLIGEHRVIVERDENETRVAIDVALKVTFGPFTLYSYDQENRALWRDGVLQSFRAITNDDGEDFDLIAQRHKSDSRQLHVSLNGADFEPREVWFPTTYWNKETLTQSKLLSTQDGEIQEITVAGAGREKIVFRGEVVSVDKYALRGDLDVDLWYDQSGEWMRLAFTFKGRDFVYDRQ